MRKPGLHPPLPITGVNTPRPELYPGGGTAHAAQKAARIRATSPRVPLGLIANLPLPGRRSVLSLQHAVPCRHGPGRLRGDDPPASLACPPPCPAAHRRRAGPRTELILPFG